MMRKLFLVLALALGFAASGEAQTALTITTLASPMTAGNQGLVSGQGATAYQTSVNLTSSTGVLAAVNGQPIVFGYVDRELLAFMTNPTGNIWNVLRAQQGTKAAPHASGAVIWIQNAEVFPVSTGLNSSGGLVGGDPPAGACTAANTNLTPWINIITSKIWTCDSSSGDWLPVLSTGSITPAATAAAIGVALQTFTLNGVVANEPLQVVVQPAPTALCPLVSVRASANNTVQLGWAVLTAAACTPASGTYMFSSPLRF